MTVHGWVAEGFEGVRDEFEAVVAAEPAEPGAQLAAYLDGRRVVDLWSDERSGGDALTGVFSVTKGAAHLVVALLVQRGVLDLDREVASYWPEFAAEGKGSVTLRQLLSHQAGAIGVDGGFTLAELADDRVVAARLAPHRPYWEPGTAYGYHGLVIGALTGEVVRRVTGRSLQQEYEELVRAPYGLDLYLGLPDELEERFWPVQPAAAGPETGADPEPPVPKDSLLAVAFNTHADEPTDLVAYANHRPLRALGPASAGGVANARAVAGLYAAAATGLDGREPLLTAATVAEFSRLHTPGVDLLFGQSDMFGLGFERMRTSYPFLGDTAFGHSGAAGSQAFADPVTGVAYGYVRRRFWAGGGAAPENARLAAAVISAATGTR
ncbi:serine hydrolase domain-containing protein [Kitasatospora sp. NPDC049285]|uniref:serine hydrolase domain-containing protein n=1 Tax=Kitasatospora sp. NPDC049285 TaxID=3157096 RepID=UPI003413E315